jgi:hypothetical protein
MPDLLNSLWQKVQIPFEICLVMLFLLYERLSSVTNELVSTLQRAVEAIPALCTIYGGCHFSVSSTMMLRLREAHENRVVDALLYSSGDFPRNPFVYAAYPIQSPPNIP